MSEERPKIVMSEPAQCVCWTCGAVVIIQIDVATSGAGPCFCPCCGNEYEDARAPWSSNGENRL